MMIDKKSVKRILLITLTNIGDIVLTTPLISALDKEFPGARLDIMVGPFGKDIFVNHPKVFKVIIYNKHLPLQEKRRLVQKLKSIKYDLVVDLKNTLFPMLIGSKYRTSPIQTAPKDVVHKKDFHLWKLKALGIEVSDAPFSLHVSDKDREYVDRLLENIPNSDNLITVSPTSKSLIKRWKQSGFARICERLIKEKGASIAMIGDDNDRGLIDDVIEQMDSRAYNLAGRTTIPQLAHLLMKSRLLITNDSAPMHIGHAVETRVLAIFGPTDPKKYGPRGRYDRIIRKDLGCSPCETAQCKTKHECMELISDDDVFNAAAEMLKG
ncbi:MAG: glycosyltransferase family 9 protein [Candidatus Omnitrophica bacterium]|nr:glycosyltransferase family 9 protein [Candidatus Omnitrophota bacterium]